MTSTSYCNCVSLYTWLTIIGGLIYFVYKYIQSKKSYWSKQNIPVASNAFLSRFVNQLHLVEKEIVEKQCGNKVFGVYEFIRPTLWVAEPEIIRNILSKDFHIFPNRRNFISGDPIINRMVSVLEGDDWKRVRAIMTPTFSTGKLKRMRPMFDECINILVNNIQKIIDKQSADNRGKPNHNYGEFDMKRIFGAFSMDVIIQVAFGTKVDSLNDENNPIITVASSLFKVNWRFILFFMSPELLDKLGIAIFDPKATKFFHALTMRIIEERKKNPSNVKRYDFLQLMMDALENKESDKDNGDSKDSNVATDALDEGKAKAVKISGMVPSDSADYQPLTTHNKTLSMTELAAQAILFFIAGYGTTATILSYCSYNLAIDTEAQEKLFKEVKEVIENNDTIDYNIIHNMKYLDGVISETFRVFPVVPFIERRASEEYSFEYNGKTIKIEKDMIVHIPSYAMLMDEEYFSEPKKFKPERFFPENRTHHPYSYLPFGAGQRNCLGMRLALLEAKLALMHTVYNYMFTTCEKTSIPLKVNLDGVGVLAPKEVILRVEKRIN